MLLSNTQHQIAARESTSVSLVCGCGRQAFYSEKKKQFDISKVPDIYDSAKYDAIHNSELGLEIEPLYQVAAGLLCNILVLTDPYRWHALHPHARLQTRREIRA